MAGRGLKLKDTRGVSLSRAWGLSSSAQAGSSDGLILLRVRIYLRPFYDRGFPEEFKAATNMSQLSSLQGAVYQPLLSATVSNIHSARLAPEGKAWRSAAPGAVPSRIN